MKSYTFSAIKERLIEMAIDSTLPLDLNELSEDMFAGCEVDSDEQLLGRLGQMVSADDLREALNKLRAQAQVDDSQPADDVVDMWEPLAGRFSVGELLERVDG